MKVSIICLVYKSPKLFEFMYKSLIDHTPMMQTGEAELVLVANDPSKELLNYLDEKKINYILNVNKIYSQEEFFEQGYSKPEYISRVYRGYNNGIFNAKGDLIVLINSDHFFSDDWLENLIKFHTFDSVVSSQLIEPPSSLNFPSAIIKDLGSDVDSFNYEGFRDFSSKVKLTGIYSGGAYMPCLMSKDIAILNGYYPEGNLNNGNSYEITLRTGDEFFFDKLASNGILHFTSQDSIVYHLKEGELRDESPFTMIDNVETTKPNEGYYNKLFTNFVVSNGPSYDLDKKKIIYKFLKTKPYDNRPLVKRIASKYLSENIKSLIRNIISRKTKF